MKNAQDEVNHLRSAMHELEATNQLLKDEYQTLQLTLNSAEQKLVEVQKENSQLVGQIMEFKDRDVLRLNQENDRAMRVQQERIKKQLEEAVAETKSSGPGGSSISPFNIFRMPKNSEGKESLESAICHSVRLPTRCFLKFEVNIKHCEKYVVYLYLKFMCSEKAQKIGHNLGNKIAPNSCSLLRKP